MLDFFKQWVVIIVGNNPDVLLTYDYNFFIETLALVLMILAFVCIIKFLVSAFKFFSGVIK